MFALRTSITRGTTSIYRVCGLWELTLLRCNGRTRHRLLAFAFGMQLGKVFGYPLLLPRTARKLSEKAATTYLFSS